MSRLRKHGEDKAMKTPAQGEPKFPFINFSNSVSAARDNENRGVAILIVGA
jgi:hypothetical protein